jgi:predicted enzyme related to lactoylglutathione lyase
MDIPNVGRFAMVTDPGGAPFYVMAPRSAQGADLPAPPPRKSPGHVDWHELYTSIGHQQAFAFYADLFGWRTEQEMNMGEAGTYRIFGYGDGESWGGMMDKPPHVPTSAWTFYVYLDGIDAAAERVKAEGGKIVMGPMEVPDGSFVLQAFDPQGALFALVSKTR